MMEISVNPTALPGVVTIDPTAFRDHRGFFYESYSKRRFAEHGIDLDFVQDNHSRSARGVVRGLHYQAPAGAQWRLVRCTVGRILDVVVDLRVGLQTFGTWIAVELSADNQRQLLIPPPFAHGFMSLADDSEVQYKCTSFHNSAAERALLWNDPDIGVSWPTDDSPILSGKDEVAPSFQHYQQNPDFPVGWDSNVRVAGGVTTR